MLSLANQNNRQSYLSLIALLLFTGLEIVTYFVKKMSDSGIDIDFSQLMSAEEAQPSGKYYELKSNPPSLRYL